MKRVFLLMLCVALVGIMLPLPQAAHAQTNLTQVIATADGVMSLRVPAGWASYDGTNDPALPLFTSQLWFGDSNEAMNTRIEYNRYGTGTVVGLGGGAFLVNSQLYQQSMGTAPTAQALYDLLAEANIAEGATLSDTVDVTIDGNNGILVAIDSISINDELSLFVSLDTPSGVVIAFASGESANAEANAELLGSILDTFKIPAEATAPSATPTTTTTIDFTSLRFIADHERTVSIGIPSTWIVENHLIEPAGAIMFADSPEGIETRIADFEQDGGDAVVGMGGWFTFVTYADFGVTAPAPASWALDLVTSVSDGYVEQGATIIYVPTEFDAVNGDKGAFVAVQWPSGQTGWLVTQNNDAAQLILVWVLSAESFERFEPQYIEMLAIVDALSIPAAADAETLPPVGEEPVIDNTPNTNNGTQGPGLGDVFNNTNNPPNPTPAVAVPAGLAVYPALDGRFSIRLPEGWFNEDRSEFGGGFIIGETQQAVTTRQDGSDIIERTTPVSGTGVQMLALPLSELLAGNAVTPALALDVVNLQVETWTANGGLIVFPAAEIENANGLQIARAGGIGANGESGFVAVIISEEADLLLFVVASAESSAAFTEDLAILEEALRSISIPAE